jgi:hypothetical protein
MTQALCAFSTTYPSFPKMGLSFGRKPVHCPVTESVRERIVRLPFFYGYERGRGGRRHRRGEGILCARFTARDPGIFSSRFDTRFADSL